MSSMGVGGVDIFWNSPLKPAPSLHSPLISVENTPLRVGAIRPTIREEHSMAHWNVFPFIQDIAHNVSSLISLHSNNDQLYKLQNETAFKDNIQTFTEASVQILTSLGVSRRDYHTILRNSVGKKQEHVLRINPFVSNTRL